MGGRVDHRAGPAGRAVDPPTSSPTGSDAGLARGARRRRRRSAWRSASPWRASPPPATPPRPTAGCSRRRMRRPPSSPTTLVAGRGGRRPRRAAGDRPPPVPGRLPRLHRGGRPGAHRRRDRARRRRVPARAPDPRGRSAPRPRSGRRGVRQLRPRRRHRLRGRRGPHPARALASTASELGHPTGHRHRHRDLPARGGRRRDRAHRHRRRRPERSTRRTRTAGSTPTAGSGSTIPATSRRSPGRCRRRACSISETRAQERRGVEEALRTDGHRARGARPAGQPRHGGAGRAGRAAPAGSLARRRRGAHRARRHARGARGSSTSRPSPRRSSLAAVDRDRGDAGRVAAGPDRPAPRPRPRPRGAPRRHRRRRRRRGARGAALPGRPSPSSSRGRRRPAPLERPSRVTAAAQRPSSLAGLSLALRSRRRAGVRLALAATAGAGLLAGVATVVVSSRTVVDEPRRYGVDFDVLAFNSFGDQTAAGIEQVFGGPEVTDAASYTSYPMLVDGRTVPGLSITPIRGESGPTMLEGEPVRHDDEVVLGVDTAERLGRRRSATRSQVQAGTRLPRRSAAPAGRRCASSGWRRSPPSRSRAPTRPGSASARSSPGPPSSGCSAPTRTCPSGPTASLAEGTDPTELIDANPDGVEDALGIPTRWFTDARPAELLQLDEASPVLAGAVAVALLAARRRARPGRVVAHPGQSPPSCRCSRPSAAPARQLARTAAWQPVPAGPRRAGRRRAARHRRRSSRASAPSPARSRWSTTRAHRRGSSSALVLAVRRVGRRGAPLVAGQVARHVASAATLATPTRPPRLTRPPHVCARLVPTRARRSRPHRSLRRSRGRSRARVGRAAGSKRSTSCGHRHRLAGLGEAEARGEAAADLRRRRRRRRRGRRASPRRGAWRGAAPSGPSTRGTWAQRRARPTEQVEQVGLARRGVEQVVAAHDLLHALVVVVHDDGHVVGGHAVVAAQHDVVGGPGDLAAQPVDDRDRLAVRRAGAAPPAGPRPRAPATSAAVEVAAGAGVGARAARAARRSPRGSRAGCRSTGR